MEANLLGAAQVLRGVPPKAMASRGELFAFRSATRDELGKGFGPLGVAH